MLFISQIVGSVVTLTLPTGQQVRVKIVSVKRPVRRNGKYIRGPQVRLGIDADRNIPVNRKEVQDAIDAGVPQSAKSQ